MCHSSEHGGWERESTCQRRNRWTRKPLFSQCGEDFIYHSGWAKTNEGRMVFVEKSSHVAERDLHLLFCDATCKYMLHFSPSFKLPRLFHLSWDEAVSILSTYMNMIYTVVLSGHFNPAESDEFKYDSKISFELQKHFKETQNNLHQLSGSFHPQCFSLEILHILFIISKPVHIYI